MTSQEKSDYIRKWHRFQQRYERIYTTKFKAALKKQVNKFIEDYLKSGTQAALIRMDSTPIYHVLLDLYKTVGPLWAAHTGLHRVRPKSMTTKTAAFDYDYKARMPMGFNERIVELMKNYYGLDLLNEAEMITDYTREVIQKILSDAASSGASINDIVRSLETSTELSSMRARRISRTETVSSANGASLLNAKELGVPMKKIWLAVNDHRTRHSHREVDDETRLLDDPFNVNGSMMLQPGARKQTNGLEVPAKEVVNCRCTLGYEVIK